MTKTEIAATLTQIATLLELKGENPFKVRAYQSGARALGEIEEPELAALVHDNRLNEVKGIGDALAQKIATLHTTGQLPFYDDLKASIAPGLITMLEVPGLGPKKIKAIHDQLGIDNLDTLAAACADGRVAALPGFGEKSQQKIAEGIRNRAAYARRHLWWDAHAIAQPIVAHLRTLPHVERAEAAGSLRRGLETVGDLDFIVAVAPAHVAPVVDWFCSQPGVREITARGETKASVRFDTGLQADLRLVPPEQFAFALHHFTGSKDHNVQMRHRALSRGLSLSEWGVTPAENASAPPPPPPPLPPIADETALFAYLGLHYIPPELREGLGEIEAAERGELPRLVQLTDLRGAFHNHTTASDGHNTLAEMTAAAAALGWQYLGIADHSKSSHQARGLDEQRLHAQIAEIRALNASGRYPGTHIFAGVECDILPDGRLDYDDATLDALALDYIVASVHSAFSQSEETMTARIIRALEHPRVTMLGHATGRLLLQREPYPLNIPKIIDAALANHVIIELNASPQRLDLDWRHWRRAAARGLLCAINPDAHDTAGLAHVQAGINSARKAWLTPDHILNTRPLADVRNELTTKTQRHGDQAHQNTSLNRPHSPRC
ncbi:DNA polymerase/3'-5' exonuclease PolX [Opitutaceae bacterium TAV3]|nr:DNA polymerase/3'-5' exonuclease PolX [Opitutaceae bacterium TAV3]